MHGCGDACRGAARESWEAAHRDRDKKKLKVRADAAQRRCCAAVLEVLSCVTSSCLAAAGVAALCHLIRTGQEDRSEELWAREGGASHEEVDC